MTEFKYVLLDFFDEDPPSVDIGMTEWIDEEITESNYETWIGEEVLCAWHSAGGGSKKRPDVTRCAAKIICFGGDRAELAKKRNVYVTTGQLNNFTTPLGKGNRKRKPKRFYDALASDDDDDDSNEDIEVPVVKKKNKTLQASSLKSMENLRKQLEETPQQKTDLKSENERLQRRVEDLEKQVTKLNEALMCLEYLPDALQHLQALAKKRAKETETHRITTPITPKSGQVQTTEHESDMVTLAGTLQAPRSVVKLWTKGNVQKYVADVLLFFFTREEMASHSLSGAVSNAHKGKPTKPALPKEVVNPLIEHFVRELKIKEVDAKAAIRAKLNTECKIKKRQNSES